MSSLHDGVAAAFPNAFCSVQCLPFGVTTLFGEYFAFAFVLTPWLFLVAVLFILLLLLLLSSLWIFSSLFMLLLVFGLSSFFC